MTAISIGPQNKSPKLWESLESAAGRFAEAIYQLPCRCFGPASWLLT